MKKYFSISTISFLYVLLSVFVKPSIVSATSYSTGSLIKLANKETIYYVASDNMKYAIPNEVTYKSWYDNFSSVENVSTKDFNSFKTSKYSVTIRPVNQLVKFSNSTKIYVVDIGAVLRWIADEQTAQKYFGTNWYKKIVTLPQTDFVHYSFGANIDGTTIFSRTHATSMSSDIDSELRNRKLILDNTNVNLASVDAVPLLKYLQENLKAGLQPGFNPTSNNYFINANFVESVLTLKLATADKNDLIFVNDTMVENATSINLDLSVGKNLFIIKVVNADGKEKVYNLEVLREKSSDNNYIKSITENLRASISPKFNSDIKEYSIRSEYDEDVLKLNVQAEDKKSTVYVNDQELSSGYYGTATILLITGENKITIKVVSENGANRYYDLIVNHYQYPKLGENDLSSMKTNFSSRIFPAFNPKTSVYYLRLTEDESRISISAKSQNSKAKVIIDGSNVASKYVSVPYGENVISVSVELVGAPEFTKTYKIRIYRGDETNYKFE
ncbi:MAG: cadherin-like beta sandwich domain-containing protein [Candidatus Magasanikbacteria bacterium]